MDNNQSSYPQPSYTNQVATWRGEHQPQLAKAVDLTSSSYTNWDQIHLSQILMEIVQWKVTALWIGGLKKNFIIKQISHITFTMLIRIDISENNIQTLDSFDQIRMSCLKQIYLQDNKIISLLPLIRCQLPVLNFIGLGGNFIQDGRFLQQMNLRSLSWLGIQHTDCQYHINNISWMVKLNTDLISTIQLESSGRIRQDRLDKKILKRFGKLQEINRKN